MTTVVSGPGLWHERSGKLGASGTEGSKIMKVQQLELRACCSCDISYLKYWTSTPATFSPTGYIWWPDFSLP